MALFPCLYNGPIQYYARLIRETEICLEQHDHYHKQSYRNRCMILGPNGPVTLSIPVVRKRGQKTRMRDIRLDDSQPWRKIHWRSLEAAYASSPYYQFLAEELRPLYETMDVTYLVEFNRSLTEIALLNLGVSASLFLSTGFTPLEESGDPRDFIHPKKNTAIEDPGFRSPEYHQVFSDRHGFHSNLSILDLLFNEGPHALSLLKSSLPIP